MRDEPTLRHALVVLAAAYCVLRGFRAALRLRRLAATHARPRAFTVGGTAFVILYVGGGLAVLAGVPGVRWLLATDLLRVAWREIQQNARAAAEGRKAAELASAWEYVRGRAAPSLADYVIATIVASPTNILPAILLAAGPTPRLLSLVAT